MTTFQRLSLAYAIAGYPETIEQPKQTRTQRKWGNMVQRCTNPNHEQFKHYGGRGITVCKRWRKFGNFLADMGEAPEGLWLDRIDNDKGYEPGNCRWVTPKVSANNKRQRTADPNSLESRAKANGLTYHSVWQRIHLYGWPADKALSTPPQPRGGMPAKLKRELGIS